MIHPALVRAVESAITFFLVTFAVTETGLLSSVNLSDTKAVETSLITAAVGALVGTLKELTGLSALRVAPKGQRRR